MSELAERLRAALTLAAAEAPLEGDYPELRAKASKDAAVLIAITDRPEPGLLLTVRREHLRTHAGQIAFPGGRVEPGEDAVAAALREAQEEILLDPANVEVVGALEPYRTVTGYVVTPVLGLVPPGLPLRPHEHEVAELFEAPLTYMLDPANQRRVSALFRGRERHYYEILWGGRRIWGATAAMIVNLSRRLRWS
jgi:8-oxo-dGTP pyrophosphatase MutT (NUDIX family)